MSKIMVTGATGLVGKPTVDCLRKQGHEVFAVSRRPDKNGIACNLFDFSSVKHMMTEIKPDHLLHLAWDTTHSTYLNSESNLAFVSASLNLLECFVQAGGKRALFTGTCFEYDFKALPLREIDIINPTNLYAASKAGLNIIASQYAKTNDISFVWARLFYLFGGNEKPTRVFPYIVNALKAGENVCCKNASAIRDYLYIEDASQALSDTICSNVEGDINICSGTSLTMETFFSTIADICHCQDKVTYLDQPVTPKMVLGDATRLYKEVGFNPTFSFRERVEQLI